MDSSVNVAALIGYFPFIVALPSGNAVICNHIQAAKRHPKIVWHGYFVDLGSAVRCSKV